MRTMKSIEAWCRRVKAWWHQDRDRYDALLLLEAFIIELLMGMAVGWLLASTR